MIEKPTPTPGTRWRMRCYDGESAVEMKDHGILDEVVVDDWFHLEQMDYQEWHLGLGNISIWIRIDKDGKPNIEIQGWQPIPGYVLEDG
jgi:hypothetical protein